MKIGLLWYDDSQVDLATKVREAAQRYEEKYGKPPNRCYVNPASLPEGEKAFSLNGIKIVTCPSVLPNHLWVGVQETPLST